MGFFWLKKMLEKSDITRQGNLLRYLTILCRVVAMFFNEHSEET